MKKNRRTSAMMAELLNNPCKMFDSAHFCKKYDVAKSSLSEDIRTINEMLEETGDGRIESYPGVGGGIKYVPSISEERIHDLQEKLCDVLNDSSRILGGGFLYTSDIMFDPHMVQRMARVFADRFYTLNADYVVTVETKGIPLASQVAFMLNIPLVVVMREAKYSEGSTVSINYFSGMNDRIRKMSLAKRAVEPGGKAVIIDDFVRGGGSLKGIEEILQEFDIETVGIGVALAAREPVKKKVNEYTAVAYVDEIDEENGIIKISANESL